MTTLKSKKLARTRPAQLIVAMGVLSAIGTSACSDESDSEDDATGGKSATTGGRSTGTGGRTSTGGAPSDAGAGGTATGGGGDSRLGGGAGEAGSSSTGSANSWIVGGWLFQDPAYFGYLGIVRDLSESAELDLASVHEFPGDFMYTAHEGVVYVGQEDLPTIERWVVNDDGELEKNGQLSFAAYGVTTTLGGGRNVIQIIDDQTAWYFDNENFRVIVFDPSTMTTEGETISYDGMQEENHDLGMGFVTRMGDYLVVPAQYWELPDEYTAQLTRAAFIDINDHSVTYADETRCGGIGFQVTADNGDVYFGPHPGGAIWAAAGLEPNLRPCLLRVKAGETEFDPDYHVDLGDEFDGELIAGLEQGDDNHAYVNKYVGEPLTPDNVGTARFSGAWELNSIELGDEAPTLSKVEGFPSLPFGGTFRLRVGTEDVRYLVSAEADLLSGQYYRLITPTTVEPGLSFPGFPGPAYNY